MNWDITWVGTKDRSRMLAWGKGRTTIASNYITEFCVTRRGSDPTVGEEKGSS